MALMCKVLQWALLLDWISYHILRNWVVFSKEFKLLFSEPLVTLWTAEWSWCVRLCSGLCCRVKLSVTSTEWFFSITFSSLFLELLVTLWTPEWPWFAKLCSGLWCWIEFPVTSCTDWVSSFGVFSHKWFLKIWVLTPTMQIEFSVYFFFSFRMEGQGVLRFLL